MRPTNLNPIIISLLIIITGLCIPKLVYAHLLETDRQMSVILHIDPTDQAIATKQQDLLFYYQDNLGKFSAYNCNCLLTISSHNDGQILQAIIPIVNANEGKFSYIFQKSGAYLLNITAKPLSKDSFVPFSITYNVFVSPLPINNNTIINNKLLMMIFIFGIFSLGVVYMVFVRDKPKKESLNQ